MTLAFLRSAVARQLALVAAGKLAAALAGVVGIRAFTELASPEVFGESNLILGVVTLGITLLVQPLTEAQIRLYPQHRRDGTGARLLRLVLGLVLAAAVLLCLLVLGWLATGLGHEPSAARGPLAAVLCGYVLVTAVKYVGYSHLGAARLQGRYALALAAEATALVAAGTLFLLIDPGVLSLLAAQLCAALLVTGGLLLAGPDGLPALTARGREEAVPPGLLSDFLRFGWPLAIFTPLTWFMAVFDRYALAGHIDAAAAGQYIAIAAIGNRLLQLPPGVYLAVFRPIVNDAAAHGDEAKWLRAGLAWIGLTVATSAVLLLAIHLAAGPILGLLLAAEYRQGGETILLLVGVASAFLMTAQAVEYMILSRRGSLRLLPSRCLGAATTIAASLLAIPALGAVGAALGSAAGYFVLLVASSILLVARPSGRAMRGAALAAGGPGG